MAPDPRGNSSNSSEKIGTCVKRTRGLTRLGSQLVTGGRTLTRTLGHTNGRLAGTGSRLTRLTRPPLAFTAVIGVSSARASRSNMRCTDTRIVSNAQHVVIPITSGIGTSHLTTNSAIILGRGLILIRRHSTSAINRVQMIGRVLSSKHLVITSTSNGPILIHHSDTLDLATVDRNSHVVISPSIQLTVRLLPGRDSQSLILRRAPSIAFTSVNNLSDRVNHVESTIRLPFRRHTLFRHCSLGPPGNMLLCKPPNGNGAVVTGTITGTLYRNNCSVSNSNSVGNERRRIGNMFLSIGKPRLLGGCINRSRHLVHLVFRHTHRHTTRNGLIIMFVSRVSSLLEAHNSNMSSSIRAAVIPRFLSRLSNIRSLSGIVIVNTSGHISVVSPTILHPNHLSIGVHVSQPSNRTTTSVIHRCLASSLPLRRNLSTSTLSHMLIQSVCAHSRHQRLTSIHSRHNA